MIDSAALQQRKVQLEAQYNQTVANANALQGAIQECDFWIALLEKPDARKISGTAQGDGNSGTQPLRIVPAQSGIVGDEP